MTNTKNNSLIPFPKSNLVAPASRPAGFAGVRARRGVWDEVCVTGALCAPAGACVDVVSRWTRHTRGAGGPGAEGAGPAPRGHAIHRVSHRDGVDPHHVVDIPAYLRERRVQNKIACRCCGPAV